MAAFVAAFYKLPKNPDRKKHSKTRIFIGAFFTSLTVSSGIKLVYLAFFSKEMQKLLGNDDRASIAFGILILIYNAALDLPEYFDLPLIKKRADKKLKRLTKTKLKKFREDEESQETVEMAEPRSGRDESD